MCESLQMAKPELPLALSLAARAALPAEFRAILTDYPRDGWHDHRDFNGLAAFWLDRHLNFRHVMAVLSADAQAHIDTNLSPRDYGKRLQRMGSNLLGDLVGHHQIEDQTYFPELARLEPRIARGFEMLDADHHDLHTLIDRFVIGANAVLGAKDDGQSRALTARFLTDLTRSSECKPSQNSGIFGAIFVSSQIIIHSLL
jgi:hypothetical protein